jgi:hypothetical protein
MTLTVTLSHAPNPDVRDGYWDTPRDRGDLEAVNVESLEEARQTCLAYIKRNKLGGGNWTGGRVYRDAERYAYVSYNGRVWTAPGSGVEITEEPA